MAVAINGNQLLSGIVPSSCVSPLKRVTIGTDGVNISIFCDNSEQNRAPGQPVDENPCRECKLKNAVSGNSALRVSPERL